MKRFEEGKAIWSILFTLILLAVEAMLLSFPAQAQTFELGSFSVEPRTGGAFPAGDFGNVDPTCPTGTTGCDFPMQIGADAGWGWNLRIHYALTDRWGVVGGFGKANLGCSATFCGLEDKPGSMSMNLGIRGIAFPLGSMDVWMEGSGTVEKVSIIRTLDTNQNPISRLVHYPWAQGFQVGLGAELPLTGRENFFFTPGFHFNYVTADPPDSHSDLRSVTATYFLAEIGFRMSLGEG